MEKAAGHSSLGIVIHEIDFVGADSSIVSVVHSNADVDYCRDEKDEAAFDLLVDGDEDMAKYLHCDLPSADGVTAFEIVAPADVAKLTILYHRPCYAPGWKILRDGVIVFHETENHGDATTPNPVSYDYVLEEGTSSHAPTVASV